MEDRAAHVGAFEIGAGQIRLVEDGSGQDGTAEDGAAQIGALHVATHQIGIGEIHQAEIELGEIAFRQHQALPIDSPQTPIAVHLRQPAERAGVERQLLENLVCLRIHHRTKNTTRSRSSCRSGIHPTSLMLRIPGTVQPPRE